MSYDEEIRDPLDRDDWEQREVYANFGLAIYFCQVLEHQLVSYLALTRAGKAGQMSQAEMDRLLDRLVGGTFGQNIGEVRDLLGGPWILESPMAEALKLRNNLAHGWMRERALQQGTSENRLAMIQELKEAQRTLQEADSVLTERTLKMLEAIGISRAALEEQYERLVERSESGIITDDPFY